MVTPARMRVDRKTLAAPGNILFFCKTKMLQIKCVIIVIIRSKFMINKYKIPLSAVVFNYFIYITPVGFFTLQVLLTGTIARHALGAFFLNPLFLISVVLTLALPFLLCGYASRSIAAYDGSEESCRRANKAVLLFTRLSIYCPILMSTMPFVVSFFVDVEAPEPPQLMRLNNIEFRSCRKRSSRHFRRRGGRQGFPPARKAPPAAGFAPPLLPATAPIELPHPSCGRLPP